DEAIARVKQFCRDHIDPVKIDREAMIPDSVIRGLGEIGVLGMTVSKEHGGQGLSQFNYCRVMEVIGAHCASTAVFVNAHHSIGLRALELFGTPEQQKTWMKPMTTGEKIAAFALTEPEAGSDASNVRTTATPTEDGKAFLLNGEKRWITNGGIAQVLTVMARTPDASDPDGKITAGNSSQISDGASAVLIMSAEKAAELGLKPRARFHSFALAGTDPVTMLKGPIPATKKILEKTGLTIDDIDLFEVNEAFASVVLAWQKETGADMSKVNVNGGAIALGHPLGCSGTKLMSTLLNEL
ncbi:MAG: acyl-CoA dehydrogenase family protein, partial [Planctomycetota bacterium]